MNRNDKVTYRDLKYCKPTAPRHQEGHAAVKLSTANGRFIAVVGGWGRGAILNSVALLDTKNVPNYATWIICKHAGTRLQQRVYGHTVEAISDTTIGTILMFARHCKHDTLSCTEPSSLVVVVCHVFFAHCICCICMC
jgi:hypothetical protein